MTEPQNSAIGLGSPNRLHETSPFVLDKYAGQLQRLIRAAAAHVPIYRDHWRAGGCEVTKMTFPDDLKYLPVIGKADFLSVAHEQRIDNRYKRDQLAKESTSGSTGEPFTMHFTRRAQLQRRIRFLSALLACGYHPGSSLMLISSRHSVSLMRLARWHYVGLEEGEKSLWRRYQEIQPDVLYGPLSSLLSIAESAIANNYTHHQPRLIISTAEQLTAVNRRYLERAFHCDVADFYGSTELGLVAWRNGGSASYHYADPKLLFEYLPLADNPALERLIVTDLHGGPMPLIRFDTGDLVVRKVRGPDDGIGEFVGRKVDCLHMPDGSKISPYQITTALEVIPDLDRYEVIQRADHSIDISFWITNGNIKNIATKAQELLANLCEHRVSVVARHSTEQLKITGRKTRPVSSEINQPP